MILTCSINVLPNHQGCFVIKGYMLGMSPEPYYRRGWIFYLQQISSEYSPQCEISQSLAVPLDIAYFDGELFLECQGLRMLGYTFPAPLPSNPPPPFLFFPCFIWRISANDQLCSIASVL